MDKGEFMKPYGRNNGIRFPSKKDHHPKRGLINWWEGVSRDDVSKKRERQQSKRSVKQDLQSFYQWIKDNL
jgi:hypothetical protein